MEAVITIAAIFRSIFLPEIAHQHFAAAYARLGIADGLIDQLGADFPFAERFILHQVLQLGDVFMRIIQDTVAFQSIPAGTTRLLVIVLYGLGYIKVNDEPDIRLIDAHSKSNGGYDHLYVFVEEQVLPFGPELAVQSRVVGNGLNAIGNPAYLPALPSFSC